MKGSLKYAGLILIGLFTAVILYPFLHESGHSIMAILLGAKVVEFHLFPAPMMVCDAGQKALWQQIAIGLAGMGFPLLFSVVLWSRRFWIWYTGLLITGINMLAFGISVVSVFSPVPHDDAAEVFRLWPDGSRICLICFLLVLAGSLAAMIGSRPIKRITAYFLL